MLIHFSHPPRRESVVTIKSPLVTVVSNIDVLTSPYYCKALMNGYKVSRIN